jgi:hypothetical protein
MFQDLIQNSEGKNIRRHSYLEADARHEICWSILPTDPCEGRGHGDVCSCEREELKICLRWRGGGGGRFGGGSFSDLRICRRPRTKEWWEKTHGRSSTMAGGRRPETLSCNSGLGRGEIDRKVLSFFFLLSEGIRKSVMAHIPDKWNNTGPYSSDIGQRRCPQRSCWWPSLKLVVHWSSK